MFAVDISRLDMAELLVEDWELVQNERLKNALQQLHNELHLYPDLAQLSVEEIEQKIDKVNEKINNIESMMSPLKIEKTALYDVLNIKRDIFQIKMELSTSYL